MASIRVSELASNIPFGARISDIDRKSLDDEELRTQLRDLFEKKGLLVFEQLDRSAEMHLALSHVFGRLQHHGLTEDKTAEPTVINLNQRQDVIRADGKMLAAFLPWHFDACYTEKLNRAALLRPIELPAEGGLTGFADGIQLHEAISPDLRSQFEELKILYHSKLMFMHQRFGMSYDWISISDSAAKSIEKSEGSRRSVHPAIWKRKSGESVLHVSPWQAAGIYGRETPEGDALLERLCQEIYQKMTPYWHRWELTDMVLWDNTRFIHAVSGNDPKYVRHMVRATIEGDYGLGFFEPGNAGSDPPAMD